MSWIGFSPFGKVEETSTSSTVNLPSTHISWPRFRISSQSLKNIEGFKSWPSTPSMLLGLKSQWEDFLFVCLGKVVAFSGASVFFGGNFRLFGCFGF